MNASINPFSRRIASLRSARNPHAQKYIALAARRAPGTSFRKSELLKTFEGALK
jgi:nucleoid DNA-binding protein